MGTLIAQHPQKIETGKKISAYHCQKETDQLPYQYHKQKPRFSVLKMRPHFLAGSIALILLLGIFLGPGVCTTSDVEDEDYYNEYYEDNDEGHTLEEDDFSEQDILQAPGPPGHEVSEEDWNHYWPPKKADGITRYTLDQKGLKEWEEMKKKKEKEFAEAVLARQDKFEDMLDKQRRDSYYYQQFLQIWKTTSRSYPYCVDGFKPSKPVLSFFQDHKNIRVLDYDSVTYNKNREKEPDLIKFIPFFKLSQPVSGYPIIADINGKPAINHLEDGKKAGPYIQRIKFSSLNTRTPTLAGGRLRNWVHIYVKSRVKLQGLLLQAIAYPMGLPFGEFRTDFDCDMRGLDPTLKAAAIIPTDKFNKYQHQPAWQRKRNLVVPCKYTHGNTNGDVFPTVYAYGGSREPIRDQPPRNMFRTHLYFSDAHCNKKMRIQLLVLAIRSFRDRTYEAFLTPSYARNVETKDGVPFPYSPDLKGQLSCKNNLVKVLAPDDQAVHVDNPDLYYTPSSHEEVDLVSSSDVAIMYDGKYDDCIQYDKLLGTGNDYEYHHRREETINTHYDANMELRIFHYRLPIGVCPPNIYCFDRMNPYETYDFHSHPLKRTPEVFYAKLRTPTVAQNVQCGHALAFTRCKGTLAETEPRIRISAGYESSEGDGDSGGGGGGGGDDYDIDEGFSAGNLHDLEFEPQFAEEFYGNSTRYFRESNNTHSWSMVFAWFLLLGIGSFTARFYKEAGGLNRDLGNGCLGIGFWIWVHIILLLFAVAFMWVGLLDVYSVKRKSTPCNSLKEFVKIPELKRYCRWRKQVIRLHRKLGQLSVALFHFALLFGWFRPEKRIKVKKFLKVISCTLRFRQIFLLSHVLLAYLGKLACFLSVLPFFLPKAKSICKDVPYEVLMLEFVGLVFFAAASIIQWREDKTELSGRREMCPVPEAIEAAEPPSAACYKMKVFLVVASSGIHMTLFFLVMYSADLIYKKHGKNHNVTGAFETIKGLFGRCDITSTASQAQVDMYRYYYSKEND